MVIDDFFLISFFGNLKEKRILIEYSFLQIFFTKSRKFATQKITRLDILVLDFEWVSIIGFSWNQTCLGFFLFLKI
jgi:hypothetical protein